LLAVASGSRGEAGAGRTLVCVLACAARTHTSPSLAGAGLQTRPYGEAGPAPPAAVIFPFHPCSFTTQNTRRVYIRPIVGSPMLPTGLPVRHPAPKGRPSRYVYVYVYIPYILYIYYSFAQPPQKGRPSRSATPQGRRLPLIRGDRLVHGRKSSAGEGRGPSKDCFGALWKTQGGSLPRRERGLSREFSQGTSRFC
jgi:hypothetical protein